jgi:hypothetical protein
MLRQVLVTPTLATDKVHAIFLLVVISGTLSALIGVLATIGIFRASPWALNMVGMNLLCIIISDGIGFLQHGTLNSDFLTRAITGILISIAWFAYFMDSGRVRNTLGHNLFKVPATQTTPLI